MDDRESNAADLSAHSALYEGSQGYMPGTNGMPSVHKINRNTSHEARGKNHDNAFVSYQIPRSDFQYNVEMLSPERFTFSDFNTVNTNSVTAANVENEPTGAGYDFKVVELVDANSDLIPIHSKVQISFDTSDASYTNQPDENLYFQYKFGTGDWTTEEIFEDGTGSTPYTTEIDLGQSVNNPLYLRWIARELIAIPNGDWDVANIFIKPTSLHQYLEEVEVVKGLNDYADHQGAGYRFIKNGEKAQVVTQRRNNIISVVDRIRGELSARTTTEYVEPVVTWNRPNTHFVLNESYDERVRAGGEAPSAAETLILRLSRIRQNAREDSNSITYSYSNNLENFANSDLANAVDLLRQQEGQFAASLMEVFKQGDLLFYRSIAREIIYPRHKNVGLKKTRVRSEFDTYKFFWKDKMFDRIRCSDTTKLGYEMTPEFKKLFKQKLSIDVMDGFHLFQSGSNNDQELYKVIGDLTYMGEDRMRHLVTRKDLDLTDASHPLSGSSSTAPFLGLEEICETPASPSGIIPVYSSPELERKKTDSIPSPQLYHNPYNEEYVESQGWLNRKSSVTNQKPSFNDYDEFSEELRLAKQNYGLVSEFRISEHMDRYILENGGNFRAKNYDFLTLDGASHDGQTHTLSSCDRTEITTSFYSIVKDDESAKVEVYPSLHPSSNEQTLIQNNAEGYLDFNKIHSPNYNGKYTSTFTLDNSINTEIEISASTDSGTISIEPLIQGVSAAGKFNLDPADTDYLLVSVDQHDALSNSTNRIAYSDPITLSVWVQPTSTVEDYQMIMADTNMNSVSGFDQNFVLYSKFTLPNAKNGYGSLGLTLVMSDNISDIDGSNSGTFTFFDKDGNIASPNIDSFNHVVLQFMPPNLEGSTDPLHLPYLAKLWLNGQELYGVFISELLNANANGRVVGYSPCQIGLIKGNPWREDYDSGIVLEDQGNGTYRIGINTTTATTDYNLQALSLGMITHNFEGVSTTH